MANAWNQVGTLMGPQGPRGATGATGAKGDRGEKGATGAQGPAGPGITFGQGAPTSASQEGAVYIDTADGFKVYQYGQTV